jgi:pimeloyl-ACP methyl ester carboxylesterase
MESTGGFADGMGVHQQLRSHLPDPFAQDPWVQPVKTPLWREAFFGLDWLALRVSPVYWGCGVQHGNGEPVVVVPGFLESDASLVELHGWLARIGYRPYLSNIGRNMDCPDHLSRRLLETVRRAYRECGDQPVRLVGHSLGGMMARNIALEHPEYTAMVVSLASPFRHLVGAHPAVLAVVDALRRQRGSGIAANIRPSCFTGYCTCAYTRNMMTLEPQYPVPHFAVYSKVDGVVEWHSCAEDDPALNDEVNCTHLGMAFHPEVYRVLAKRLRHAV